jgi:alcohol dehydrogenase
VTGGAVRGATLVGPERIEIREYPRPAIPADGALLEVEAGGVCGTDVKYFHGTIPLPYPVILGHEIAGRIAQIGPAARRIHGVDEGDRVILKGTRGCGHCPDCRRGGPRFCKQKTNYGGTIPSDRPPHLFGGFADALYVAPDVVLTRVPDGMSADAACLVGSVMANGYQWAVVQGGAHLGDYVLIQGPGQQGLACLFAAKAAGAGRVVVSGRGRDAERLRLATAWGADRIVDVDQEDVLDVVREETGGHMADVVVDVSGSPAAIPTSLKATRRQGTMVLAGLVGTGVKVPLELDDAVWSEKRIQGAYTADATALDATLRSVVATGFPVTDMASHVFPLEETERCIHAVGGEIEGLYPVKAIIRP